MASYSEVWDIIQNDPLYQAEFRLFVARHRLGKTLGECSDFCGKRVSELVGSEYSVDLECTSEFPGCWHHTLYSGNDDVFAVDAFIGMQLVDYQIVWTTTFCPNTTRIIVDERLPEKEQFRRRALWFKTINDPDISSLVFNLCDIVKGSVLPTVGLEPYNFRLGEDRWWTYVPLDDDFQGEHDGLLLSVRPVALNAHNAVQCTGCRDHELWIGAMVDVMKNNTARLAVTCPFDLHCGINVPIWRTAILSDVIVHH